MDFYKFGIDQESPGARWEVPRRLTSLSAPPAVCPTQVLPSSTHMLRSSLAGALHWEATAPPPPEGTPCDLRICGA